MQQTAYEGGVLIQQSHAASCHASSRRVCLQIFTVLEGLVWQVLVTLFMDATRAHPVL